MENFAIAYLLPLSYILLASSILGIVFFAVLSLKANFKTGKKTLFGIMGLIAIILIGYSMGQSTNEYLQSFGVNAKQERWIEAGLFTTYATALVTIVLILFTEIKTALTK